MSTETIIFQIGAVLFALSSLYFLFAGKKKPGFDTEFFISFITTTSYVLMTTGVATITAPNGETIYWSRWLFYMIACSMLMYDTSMALKIPSGEYPWMVLLTWMTMFNGFLASYITSTSKWYFYVISSVAFIGLLYKVINGEENPGFKSLKPFVLVGWTLFPVVFLLGPAGIGLINSYTAQVGYLILDFATKIVFGYFTSKLK
ncbi:bacteriorhodopsin [Thermoproteota archaeon]